MRPKTHSGFSERERKVRDVIKTTMFSIQVSTHFLGVTILMLLSFSISGFEVEGGRKDLIGLGEGAEGSPSPLLNPTFTLCHLINEFIPPPFSANLRREEKEKEEYGEERESEKRGG